MTPSSFIPPVRTLMGPGPSDVHPRVLQAMARPTIGHLDPEFVRMMDELKELTRYAFITENDLTMVVSGPGSVGMETCFVNLVEPGDKVVVCENGVFGGRMKENVVRCGGVCVPVSFEWGRAVDPGVLDETLRQHPDAKVVAFVHAETSTGALSDARALVETAHRHDCLAVVDCVTSLGGVELRVDDWGIDAAYSGSQKCLSCAPGLSPVTFGERARRAVAERKRPVQSWFMDLNLVMQYWGSAAKRSYHHTAPVNALYGMHEALVMFHEEGRERAWKRHLDNYRLLCSELESMGLSYAVPEGERIPQLNAVVIPDGVDDAALRRRLLDEHGIEIGGGLGPMAGKIWRIGLMGQSSSPAHVERLVSALRSAMA